MNIPTAMEMLVSVTTNKLSRFSFNAVHDRYRSRSKCKNTVMAKAIPTAGQTLCKFELLDSR